MAVYVRTTLQASVWEYSSDNRQFELLWIRVGNLFIAVLYHPPKPLYSAEDLLNYIEDCVEEVSREFPSAHIVIAGDMNQLPNDDLVECTSLTQIVQQPTRGANILDRLYVSCYTTMLYTTAIQQCPSRGVYS